jgi:predicted ATPase
VKLDCMDGEAVNTMVSETETLCVYHLVLLGLSGVIYHKTKGNPIFVSRII